MTKDNAAQYLPLVKALADGKTIQIMIGPNQWMDKPQGCDFSFELEASSYRIKPEPREWWVVCSRSPNPIFGCSVMSWGHETRESAEREVAARHDSELLKIIHMREVV